jgi:DNA-binding XRE family transcriptional regulator
VHAQAPDDRYAKDATADRTKAGAEMLLEFGAHVTLRRSVHEKLVVIDESILWEASLNLLSHRDTHERVNRFCGRIHAEKAIKKHNLYACEVCMTIPGFGFPDDLPALELKELGKTIAARRIAFGWSQLQLAEFSGVNRTVIAEIESGNRDARHSTLARIHRVLNLRISSCPTFLLPRLQPLVQGSMSTASECMRGRRPIDKPAK